MHVPHVAILMTVKDGARYLPDQLKSFADQDHANWTLMVSDDGSTDGGPALIEEFKADNHAVKLLEGPQQGHAANTLFILSQAQPLVEEGAWIATSDQDDIWLPHRISRGVEQLQNITGPALYCSRTIICDTDMTQRGLSKAHHRPPGFGNALVQNIASGNTSLLNSEAAKLVCAAAQEAKHLSIPDWWVYLLITGAGGTVIFDQTPTLLYRQHRSNQLGENRSITARLRRLSMMIGGDFRKWNDANIDALHRSQARLSPEHRETFTRFAQLRSMSVIKRLITFRQLKLYRQSRLETFAIWLATAMGRL